MAIKEWKVFWHRLNAEHIAWLKLEPAAQKKLWILSKRRCLDLFKNIQISPTMNGVLYFSEFCENKIHDWHRRAKVRKGLGLFWSFKGNEPEGSIQELQDTKEKDALDVMESSDSIKTMHAAIHSLPLRQQQAFLLHAWEEFSVKETAKIMGVSEGSVKTHYSRAVSILRESLKDYE